jgi:hypothetical protein
MKPCFLDGTGISLEFWAYLPPFGTTAFPALPPPPATHTHIQVYYCFKFQYILQWLW